MSIVQTSIKNSIATIKINRPEQLNALSVQVLADLKKEFEAVEQDNEVGVIILTGEGDKAFIAEPPIKNKKNNNVFDISGQSLKFSVVKPVVVIIETVVKIECRIVDKLFWYIWVLEILIKNNMLIITHSPK